nr:uncharacterized protein CTRU02_04633 [Colletotrichum truncatum]KAF6795070.1 hypothetical protein CTRU02_04633 [Colletotrichum truncatum]
MLPTHRARRALNAPDQSPSAIRQPLVTVLTGTGTRPHPCKPRPTTTLDAEEDRRLAKLGDWGGSTVVYATTSTTHAAPGIPGHTMAGSGIAAQAAFAAWDEGVEEGR